MIGRKVSFGHNFLLYDLLFAFADLIVYININIYIYIKRLNLSDECVSTKLRVTGIMRVSF